ncbi:hypothetical protein [Sutterella sp.]|uniref:hypothetical protein n=1 Tax=Sutterella sp. TaxID=1981025 RepID=UPI003FD8B53B
MRSAYIPNGFTGRYWNYPLVVGSNVSRNIVLNDSLGHIVHLTLASDDKIFSVDPKTLITDLSEGTRGTHQEGVADEAVNELQEHLHAL